MTARILIADDEELERRAIRKILEGEPALEIVEAENGVEVLDLVASGQVTVAILDIKMPGLDGIAVAERLRQSHPDVAVVFLTAYDQFDYARSALRLQVDDFLLKPASSTEVVSTIRRVLDRVASREGERESSRAALFRLDSAITLVAQRLRHDLSEGMLDLEQVVKFLDLQAMPESPLTILECRPTQPSASLGHLAKLAESWFSVGDSVALAGVQGQTVRIMRLGAPHPAAPDPQTLIRKFRETVRNESGCLLLVGAAVATAATVHPDALVTAAHRAATVANVSNPVMVVSVGSDAPSTAGRAAGPVLPVVVTRVLGLLEARMAEDLSLNEVAGLVGLSPSHLSRQLARATGNGFADCLAHFRIAGAKNYLANGNLSVKEVAHLVGFHDPAYFARVFRRLEGLSPADFRLGAAKEGTSR
jgi:two-component system response regulator YesN